MVPVSSGIMSAMFMVVSNMSDPQHGRDKAAGKYMSVGWMKWGEIVLLSLVWATLQEKVRMKWPDNLSHYRCQEGTDTEELKV